MLLLFLITFCQVLIIAFPFSWLLCHVSLLPYHPSQAPHLSCREGALSSRLIVSSGLAELPCPWPLCPAVFESLSSLRSASHVLVVRAQPRESLPSSVTADGWGSSFSGAGGPWLKSKTSLTLGLCTRIDCVINWAESPGKGPNSV